MVFKSGPFLAISRHVLDAATYVVGIFYAYLDMFQTYFRPIETYYTHKQGGLIWIKKHSDMLHICSTTKKYLFQIWSRHVQIYYRHLQTFSRHVMDVSRIVQKHVQTFVNHFRPCFKHFKACSRHMQTYSRSYVLDSLRNISFSSVKFTFA